MRSTHPARTLAAARLLAVSVLLGPAAVAVADDDPVHLAALAASCANCHGTDGVGSPPMVPLAGMPQERLAEQLLAFRRGEAADPTVMDRIASGYSEDELRALARYFASLSQEESQ